MSELPNNIRLVHPCTIFPLWCHIWYNISLLSLKTIPNVCSTFWAGLCLLLSNMYQVQQSVLPKAKKEDTVFLSAAVFRIPWSWTNKHLSPVRERQLNWCQVYRGECASAIHMRSMLQANSGRWDMAWVLWGLLRLPLVNRISTISCRLVSHRMGSPNKITPARETERVKWRN